MIDIYSSTQKFKRKLRKKKDQGIQQRHKTLYCVTLLGRLHHSFLDIATGCLFPVSLHTQPFL